MCSNYKPVTRLDRLLTFFGAVGDHDAEAKDVWPLGLAPFIRLAESGRRVAQPAQFGLLPHFAKEVAYGRRTYNARMETVHKLPSFLGAWKTDQRCIVPAECIYGPCWETGSAVRWCIQQASQVPLDVAGIWRNWKAPDGQVRPTFAMLTVNADGRPVSVACTGRKTRSSWWLSCGQRTMRNGSPAASTRRPSSSSSGTVRSRPSWHRWRVGAPRRCCDDAGDLF